jgi:Restriction endonuclease
MEWQNYESVVKYIYERLGISSGIRMVGHGSSCRVTGKSGVNHQIDVLTEHSDGVHTYNTAIECKYWQSRVDKAPVTKLAEILEDAGIEKGVIVSKAGFTDDAVLFAKYKNIGLVELRAPVDDDWQDRIRDITVNINVLGYAVTDLQIVNPEPSCGEPLNISVSSVDILFDHPDGTRQQFQEIVNERMKTVTAPIGQAEKCEVAFQAGTFLTIEGRDVRRELKAIRFCITPTINQTKVEIKGRSYILWVMNVLFEDKRFAVWHNGDVRPF